MLILIHLLHTHIVCRYPSNVSNTCDMEGGFISYVLQFIILYFAKMYTKTANFTRNLIDIYQPKSHLLYCYPKNQNVFRSADIHNICADNFG